mgnify:FL=1
MGVNSMVSNTTGSYNTALGRSALNANTTASNNTAVGYQAGYSNTTGTQNNFFGTQAGYSSTTDNQAFFGYQAGYNTTTGTQNTVMGGYRPFYSNTTGAYNTVFGSQALYSNTTASNNTAVGYQAGYSNTTGTNVAAFGKQSMYSNTTGAGNSAFGIDTLFSNSTGNFNTAVGGQALLSNTTASNNVAVGYQAGYSNTTGGACVFIGVGAGYSSNNASGANTFVGEDAGRSVTTGNNNTFYGRQSGYYVTSGSANTILGKYSGNQGGLDIRTASNYIVLSDGDGNPRGVFDSNGNLKVNASGNYTSITVNSTGTIGGGYFAVQQNSSDCGFFGTKGDVLGNSNKDIAIFAQSSLGIYTYTNNGTAGPYVASSGTSWTNASDERLKNITGEIQNGLTKVCSLRAAEFTWKSDESAKQQVGLIAQDVQAVLPEAVSQSVQSKDDPTEYLGVSYTEVTPLLVAAIKELKSELDSVKTELATLKGA